MNTRGDIISLIKKIWNILIILVLIIEAVLVIMFTAPNLFGIKPFVVTSGSMKPKYEVGSLIYVKKVDANKIKKGDAITFYMSNSNIVATHEVYLIDKENKLFRTYGINNKDENGNIIKDANPVKFNNLIGKPIFTIPYLGYVNRYVTTKPGIYVVILVTFFIIGISFLIDNKKENKKEVEVKENGTKKRKEK